MWSRRCGCRRASRLRCRCRGAAAPSSSTLPVQPHVTRGPSTSPQPSTHDPAPRHARSHAAPPLLARCTAGPSPRALRSGSRIIAPYLRRPCRSTSAAWVAALRYPGWRCMLQLEAIRPNALQPLTRRRRLAEGRLPSCRPPSPQASSVPGAYSTCSCNNNNNTTFYTTRAASYPCRLTI